MATTKDVNMKVLLVEDHQLAAKIADFILKSLGCQVDIACTGQQAMEKAGVGVYDLIFMDLGLPDYDGITVTLKLREAKNLTPVYALTAHTDQDHKNRAHEAGMNGFLIKPLEITEVQQVLQTAANG